MNRLFILIHLNFAFIMLLKVVEIAQIVYSSQFKIY